MAVHCEVFFGGFDLTDEVFRIDIGSFSQINNCRSNLVGVGMVRVFDGLGVSADFVCF